MDPLPQFCPSCGETLIPGTMVRLMDEHVRARREAEKEAAELREAWRKDHNALTLKASDLMEKLEVAEKARAHTIEVLNDCYKAMGDMQTRYDRMKDALSKTVDMVASARIQRNAAVVGLRAEIDACIHDRKVEHCGVCERRSNCNLFLSFRRAT